jgi:hypothetical protein
MRLTSQLLNQAVRKGSHFLRIKATRMRAGTKRRVSGVTANGNMRLLSLLTFTSHHERRNLPPPQRSLSSYMDDSDQTPHASSKTLIPGQQLAAGFLSTEAHERIRADVQGLTSTRTYKYEDYKDIMLHVIVETARSYGLNLPVRTRRSLDRLLDAEPDLDNVLREAISSSHFTKLLDHGISRVCLAL